MPRVKAKILPSVIHPTVTVMPSLGERLQRWRQEPQMLVSFGVGALVCVLVGIGIVVFFWGPHQKKGLEELQTGIQAMQKGETASAASQLSLAERALAEGGEYFLAQLARLSLGQVAEQKGDWVTARQHYEKGAELDGPARAEALLAAARVSALVKDDEAVTLYYKKFLEQYPDSPMGELLRQKIEK